MLRLILATVAVTLAVAPPPALDPDVSAQSPCFLLKSPRLTGPCSSPQSGTVCKATEYCCPDAKHCLTPTAKVCGATAKCAADETCCPLTKVRSLSAETSPRSELRLLREVARPSLTTGLALVAALRQGRRRL